MSRAFCADGLYSAERRDHHRPQTVPPLRLPRCPRAAALWATCALAACERAPHGPEDAPSPAAAPDPLASLRGLEAELRAVDVTTAPPPERATGANPVDVAAIGADRLVGVLAGDDAVVLLDPSARELARVDGPSGSRTLAVAGDRAYVGGAGSPVVHRYRRVGDALAPDGTLAFPGVSIAALAVHAGGAVYAADAVDGVLRVARGRGVRDVATCRGASRAVASASAIAVSCVLDHTALIVPVDPSGAPRGEPVRITHDGPVWTVAIAPDGDALLVAIGGAEDHPLDRTQGFFGYVDSFVYLYRVARGAAERLGQVDVSQHGVVTPKWIDVERDGDAVRVDTFGFASEPRLSIDFGRVAASAQPVATAQPGVPGGTRAVSIGDRLVIADPLLDAWVVVGASAIDTVAVPARRAAEPAPRVRLGELLFFTTLMSPWATSDDAHSRFTCETCHWEGYGDGRVHFTGRDDVHATTRTLRGLAQERPYFSRANDRTMVDMVHAEFGVAARGTGRTAWFSVDAGVVPWLARVPGLPASLAPLDLREAFMRFLGAFGHEANPAVGARTAFSPAERRGAEVFRDRCEGCHQARLLVDDETSRVPFIDWERRVMSPQGPIAWATATRVKTGVEPYVHPDGSRVPALRRLYRKHPYFTNGSAGSLDAILERARLGETAADFRHDAAGGAVLPADERGPLLAFLRLL